MKKVFILSLVLCGFLSDPSLAAPVRRASSRSVASDTTAPDLGKATSVRSAVKRSSAPAATPAVAARSAVRTTATRSSGANATPVVAARAAAKQKVINTSTKVAGATQNIVVNEECRIKYEGCMDSFCMLDNETGGRCLCSNRNAELDLILSEIEKLDQQSYQMATFGVEKIEMGANAEEAIANANAAAQSVLEDAEKSSSRRTLDLSLWDNASFEDDEVEEIFFDTASSAIDGQTGDNLHSVAAQLCSEQIPECSADIQMLQLMYSQRIKSDCAAYENSLKQQKNASQQKLMAAEQALRTAALEQVQQANKYDLGQCTVEFRKCMQTTGGCGDDFAKCASVAAMDLTNTRKSKSGNHNNVPMHTIKGSATSIDIYASTYDTLLGKKPLCAGITKSCVAVADQVWDTFLRDIAPQIKSAELIAEDNARQSCIGNISSCFQKACKENMDPKDPDGSYDMCLTRPETMLNVCRVPLNACGINADSAAAAEESMIWEFIIARLASMRVDSCTNAVKECLTDEDRCGEDYLGCIGLETDTIIRMCPAEKLVACQKQYGTENILDDESVYYALDSMVQGLMLNIDNSFMEECQAAADEAMIKVCGDTETCNGLTVDENIGARTLEYELCEYDNGYIESNCKTNISQVTDDELGRAGCVESDGYGNCLQQNEAKSFAGRIKGQIPWEVISFIDENGNIDDKYFSAVEIDEENSLIPEDERDDIKSELDVLKSNISTAIATIESDPRVQFCMTGRRVQGMRNSDGTYNDFGRRADAITKDKDGNEQENTGARRFPKLTHQMRGIIATAALKAAQDNYHRKYDELNEQMLKDYVKLGERAAEVNNQNALDARREAARLACINYASASVLATSKGKKNGVATSSERELVGSKTRNDWQYKETVTSTFNWETLNCHRCIRTQTCACPKAGKWCKDWDEPKESCNDIQF